MAESQLYRQLKALRMNMAEAAQREYDQWSQDAQGIDEELGSGGICDAIAEAIRDVVAQEVEDADTFPGGAEGDDHEFVIVQRKGEAFGVDIPAGVYETGGGYNWKKRAGVTFLPEHVVIFEAPLQTWPE